jgi:hypothetical protein
LFIDLPRASPNRLPRKVVPTVVAATLRSFVASFFEAALAPESARVVLVVTLFATVFGPAVCSLLALVVAVLALSVIVLDEGPDF